MARLSGSVNETWVSPVRSMRAATAAYSPWRTLQRRAWRLHPAWPNDELLCRCERAGLLGFQRRAGALEGGSGSTG